jgi:hypothetical protein
MIQGRFLACHPVLLCYFTLLFSASGLAEDLPGIPAIFPPTPEVRGFQCIPGVKIQVPNRDGSVRTLKREYFLDTLTAYSPWKTDEEDANIAAGAKPGENYGINGRCNKSKSQWAACDFPLEAHMANNGSVPAVMAAVARSGGSWELYGGIFTTSFPPKLGFINIMAGDTYGESSNGLSKMDILVRNYDPSSKVYQLVNTQGVITDKQGNVDVAESSRRCTLIDQGSMTYDSNPNNTRTCWNSGEPHNDHQLRNLPPCQLDLRKNGCRVHLITCGRVPEALFTKRDKDGNRRVLRRAEAMKVFAKSPAPGKPKPSPSP